MQVRLTDELASSTARVSALQLELTTQRQKAAALQSSLNTALQEGQQHGAQLTATENQLHGEEHSTSFLLMIHSDHSTECKEQGYT